jgi:hypothetical protein
MGIRDPVGVPLQPALIPLVVVGIFVLLYMNEAQVWLWRAFSIFRSMADAFRYAL